MLEQSKYLSQRISEQEKLANNKEWAKRMIDYICQQHLVNAYHETRSSDTSLTVVNDYANMLANYQLYNNVINQKDFERECNPLGLSSGQFKEEIHPYNKTYNKIQVLLGEELRRPFDYKVITTSEDGIRMKLVEKDEAIRDFLESIVEQITQTYSQQMQASLDPNLGEQEKQAKQQEAQQALQEKIDRIVDSSYIQKALALTSSQKREIQWSKILRYLLISQSILDKKNDGFKHGLIAGVEGGWIGIDNGEPCVKILNPLGLIYDKSPDTKWIQDGNYAGYKTVMSIPEIIAQYGDDLSEKDLKDLEEHLQGGWGSGGNSYNRAEFNAEKYFFGLPVKWSDVSQYGITSSFVDHLNVYHVEWKSLRKVYFVTYENMYGEKQTDIVDASSFYIPPYAVSKKTSNRYGKSAKTIMFDGYEVEERWITDIWEGVRIGDDKYCRIGRKNYQYRNADNPNDVKLGYHGVAYSNTNSPIISLMGRMKPFQYLYFIIAHRMKEMIAKDKGKVFHFDVSMIDPTMGLEQTLFYLEKMDIDFYNPLQNANTAGGAQRGKITGSTDRSNMQHIMNYVQLLNAIDEQISDVAGVTKQREGSSSQYETATAVESAITKSTHITEIYFHTHEKLWECMLNSLVQVTQECWKHKGVRKQYVLDDLSIELLEATPDELSGADLGVFISNSRKDQDIFTKMEKLSEFALSSGQAKLSDMVALFKSNSSAEMESNLKDIERKTQQQQENQQRQEQESLKQMQDAQLQAQERQMQHEKELKQMDIDAQIQKAEIDSFKFNRDQDINDNAVPDQLEIEKLRHQNQVENRKLNLEERRLEQDRILKEKEIQVKKAQANKPKTSK